MGIKEKINNLKTDDERIDFLKNNKENIYSENDLVYLILSMESDDKKIKLLEKYAGK